MSITDIPFGNLVARLGLFGRCVNAKMGRQTIGRWINACENWARGLAETEKDIFIKGRIGRQTDR
eukprot:scaffold307219_cov34-Prasinocladus_malaysianus.AAC.1